MWLCEAVGVAGATLDTWLTDEREQGRKAPSGGETKGLQNGFFWAVTMFIAIAQMTKFCQLCVLHCCVWVDLPAIAWSFIVKIKYKNNNKTKLVS